jgi:hypothetical protein
MHSNECPRGFKWCKEREECIPIRSDVDDKLTMRHQRYFFKGDGAMDQNVKYASELVDIAFDEGFDTFTKLKIAEGEMERLLDMCGKKHTTECGDMSEDSEEMDGEEYIEKPPITGDNDIDHVPNQHVGTLYNSIRKQLGEFRNLTLEGRVISGHPPITYSLARSGLQGCSLPWTCSLACSPPQGCTVRPWTCSLACSRPQGCTVRPWTCNLACSRPQGCTVHPWTCSLACSRPQGCTVRPWTCSLACSRPQGCTVHPWTCSLACSRPQGCTVHPWT